MKTIILAGALALALSGCSNDVSLSANTYTSLHPYNITQEYGIFSTTYHIRLGERMEAPSDNQTLAIVTTLEKAGANDKVVFHIAGPGGSVDGLVTIISAINLSKAHVIMSVEGNSYSAYATLALHGDEFNMSKDTFLMFHLGSINGLDCSLEKGLFDGIPASVSCQNMKNAYLKQITAITLNNSLFTQEERLIILAGYEVYLSAEEVNSRLK